MDVWQWWGLFVSAFLSSTLLPGGSEVALVALSLAHSEERVWLWAVATSGNTLGAMAMWGLGWAMSRRFGLDTPNNTRRQRAIEKLRRYGTPALILSWLPIIGDPLCFAAGWLRMSIWRSLFFIVLGKGLRYAAIILLA